MKHAVIVGGGISGLSAAFELDKAGVSYTLVERDTRLGGVILTHKVDGNTLEAGPDSFISQKPAALQLIRELGLGDQVIGSNDHLRSTFIRKGGKLIPMPDGLMMMIPTKAWPMAKSPLLSWGTKIRMGLEYFRKPSAEPLPDRSVADFIGDHFGQETVDYLAEPLLAGVFGGDPKQLSALSTLPRFVEMERKYGSLSKAALSAPAPPQPPPGSGPTSLFRTMKGGLSTLVEALQPKQSVLLGSAVDALEGNAEGFRVRRDGDWIQATDVILTGPSYEAGRLLEGRLGELLQSTGYSSSATVTVGYRKSELGRELTGFGILIPGVERKRMRACTFVANKFSHRVAEGHEVIRCFLGGTADEGVLEESDENILEIVRSELREVLGIEAPVAFYRVQRWRKSMAQYTVGHQKRVKTMMSLCDQIPGLHLAGNGYQGIGLPDCVEMGRAAAKRVILGEIGMSNQRLEQLRQAWTSEIDPDDYDTHMRSIGQGPTNADLSREMIERNPPVEGKSILIAGAGSGQMFDFVDSGFLFDYQVTFTDISQPFLDALKPRIEFAGLSRSRVVVDDLADSKLEGPYAGALIVLVLEHLDWRAALASLNRLVSEVLWIIVQRNPESMATAVTPGRTLPGTMAVVCDKVHPHLIPEAELVEALSALGFRQTVCAPRSVDDGKEMVGYVFRRIAS